MLTASFLREIENTLGKKLKKKIHVRRVTPVSGGSINQSAKLDTSAGLFFMKTNDAFRYPRMFENESEGLNVLRAAKCFTVPEVICVDESEGIAFIIMNYIESRQKQPDFWINFGRSLAQMHNHSGDRFGFSSDNYIGSLKQSNSQHNKWSDFFIEERLQKQLRLAISKGALNAEDEKSFNRLYMRIDEIIPPGNPALLHGDLWSGNFLTGENGEPCLIDPAVYYGHREMDLSMTKLFGGFDQQMYDSYQEIFSLEPGLDERVDIHNLYPLLVHVNLFQGGYISQVREILKRFR